MRKSLILGILLSVALTSFAYEPLDSLFDALSSLKHTSATNVKYSGSFSPECPGFFLQQPDGEGWTEGVRLTLSNISNTEGERLLEIFDKSEDYLGFLLSKGSMRGCLDEEIKTVYCGYYDSTTHTFHFLRAGVEDKVCIPKDWYQRAYYYAPAKNTGSQKQSYSPHPQSLNWPVAKATLHTEMKYNSPFYAKNATRIDSTYYAILEELPDADNYDSYRLLRKLAASCGDGHTFPFASLPQKDSPRWSQFSTVLIGDRLFINSVESDELEALGLKRGIEITAINGETPKEYASRELIPYVSSSTPQWAEHKVFDDYGFSEGRNGSEFTLTLSPDSGKTTSDITLKRDASSIKPRNPRSSKVSLQMTPDSIVIVTIPNFASSRITEDFDKIYPQILNSRGLIIDLRNNEGGNSGFGDYILQHLTSDSIPSNPWTTPIYKPAFASWGNAPETYESPTRKMAPLANITPYLGPVIIVTNRGTFSAAEDFCAVFRNMNRGQIIGTPTAGSTGNGVRVKLTKNISANICSKHDRMADGTEFVGIGIIPDIIIEDSPESYFSDKDIVLEKAISIISN